MASLLLSSTWPRRLSIEEFLQIDFGPGLRAELDDGFIRMMAGGTYRHSRVQTNILVAIANRMRGSGCRPYGSDMAVKIADKSVRYPDVTVDCAPAPIEEARALMQPRVVFEVLSPTTRGHDEGVKLAEYRTLATVDTIVLVDPEAERCRVLQRTGPGAWSDVTYADPADIALPALDLTLPHAEIFARD